MGNNRQEHGRETVCMSVCVCGVCVCVYSVYECVCGVCMSVWDVCVHACVCVFVGCSKTLNLNTCNTKQNGWRY